MTKREKLYMDSVASLGCVIQNGCKGRITIHHCGTYMGGGRNHFRTVGLCWLHHLGPEGIDGKHMSKRKWEDKYGTEEDHLETVRNLINQEKM